MSESAASAPPNAGMPAEGGRVVAIAPAAPFVAPSPPAQAPPATQPNPSAASSLAMNQPKMEVAQPGPSTSSAQREESKTYAPPALSEQATIPNTAPMVTRGGAGESAGATMGGGAAIGAVSGPIVGAAVGSPSAGAAVGPGAAGGGAIGVGPIIGAAPNGWPTISPPIAVTFSTPDHSVDWIVGQDGRILRRGADGAIYRQHSGVTTDLVAGAAPTPNVCWIVGRSGTIIRTIDGGDHWTLIAPPAIENLAAVSAVSANAATITTVGGRRFATSDGGTSWHSQ